LDKRTCPECGVPMFITEQHSWVDSGAIVQSSNETVRPFFIECANLDPLFNGVEQLIGAPIRPIVIVTKRRAIRAYIDNILDADTQEKLGRREIDWRPSNDRLRMVARLAGMGRYEVVDHRCEGGVEDFVTETVSDPPSIPFACGTMAAAFEALFGRELGVTYRLLSQELLEITCYPKEHPKKYKGKMNMPAYDHRKGGLDLERCSACGGPAILSDYRWLLEKGVIVNRLTGRRMAILGSEANAIVEELEREYGEVVHRALVEAQRRFVRTGFYSMEDVGDEDNMRNQLALRGLGELKEMKIGHSGFRLSLDNAGLPLIIVGLIQGLFETTFGTESYAEWQLSPTGDLEAEVTPRTAQETVNF
jgi:hypothetical protein